MFNARGGGGVAKYIFLVPVLETKEGCLCVIPISLGVYKVRYILGVKFKSKIHILGKFSNVVLCDRPLCLEYHSII